jgi:predicted anti-sigma-YlaC factor YlaD
VAFVDCTEVIEKLAEYLDEDARNELRRAIEEHLSHCRDCRVEVDTVKKTIVLYQADREVELPIAVSSRLEAALAREYRSPGERSSSD